MFSTTLSVIARSNRSAKTALVRALSLALAVSFASGCALLSDNLDRAAKAAGHVVTYYCDNITIPEVREEVRAAVNKHAAPNSVAIECASDPAAPGQSGPILKSDDPASVAAPPETE